MKKTVAWLLIGALGILIFGCLSFESKEYNWTINKDGSGSGKIVWRNIYSSGNEEENMADEDFISLINDYLEGENLEDESPAFKKVEKRLFIEDGVLCGEMTFEFGNYEDAGFYRYKGEGPYMYMLAITDESFYKSNGDWGGEDFQIIFWPDNVSNLKLVTTYGDPNEEGAEDLMSFYEDWEEDGILPEIQGGTDNGDDPASKIRDAME